VLIMRRILQVSKTRDVGPMVSCGGMPGRVGYPSQRTFLTSRKA